MCRSTSASLRKANRSMDRQMISLRKRKKKKAPMRSKKISQLKWLRSSCLIRTDKLHLSSRLTRARKQQASSK